MRLHGQTLVHAIHHNNVERAPHIHVHTTVGGGLVEVNSVEEKKQIYNIIVQGYCTMKALCPSMMSYPGPVCTYM